MMDKGKEPSMHQMMANFSGEAELEKEMNAGHEEKK
jgi:hypothetical protein